MTLVYLVVSSFLVCLIVTPLLAAICRKAGLVDRPDSERKIHRVPIPRVGGVAVAISYCAAFLPLLVFLGVRQELILNDNARLVLQLIPAAGLVFAVGLVDDLFGLRPWQKLAGQFAAAGLAYAAGVQIRAIGDFQLGWLCLPLTLIWIVGCSNAFNLIDGLDGLAAGVGLFATCTVAIAATLNHTHELQVATLPLLGALLAFLLYNFSPASIFLGDCGSLLIGLLLACFSVIWSQKTTTALGVTAPLMAVALPVLDVALAVARRYLRQKPIFGADRGHIHHKLLALGCRPRNATLILYGFCTVAAAFSLLQTVLYTRIGGAVVLVFCGLIWLCIWRLGYVEFSVVRHLVTTGELRRILTSRIRLQVLDESLSQANTFKDCVAVMSDALRDLGVLQFKAKMGNAEFSQEFAAALEAWDFRLSLSPDSYVHLRYPQTPGHAATVAALSELLERQLRPKAKDLEQQAAGQWQLPNIDRPSEVVT